jgi:predicted ATPase/class 3 adenylate cyclase
MLCRSCGEPNEPTARFCQACGEPLVEEPQVPLEVRKTVTVLFADVAGSTALGEQLDPEPLRRVMARYFEEMRAVLTHYGGTVEKFIGDAVMAVFGVPTVHEDDALRAVRAAHQMRERLGELNRELEPEFGIRLEMRIGINMGEVVAGRATGGQTLVTGDAVNLAKRLEQAAPLGGILIGKSMYPLVKDAVEVGPLESFKVKGKAEPVSPLRLDAVDRLAAGVARRLDRPLVDRRDELAALQIAFGRAEVETSCRLFTLLGAAGIGKSRLIAEFVEWLGDRATVLIGRCLPYGEGITFWPLREIVRAVGGTAGVRSALAGTADADLVAERVLTAVGASPDSARGEEAAWAFRKLFEVLAQQQPVVVVLEDIHWASATLLDLVEYLLGWTQAPVLLVCLARPDLVDRRPGWATLRPNVDAVVVDRLSETDAEKLLAQTLPGQRHFGEAQEGQVQRITEAAEGNPLFLEQMAAMLAEANGGDGALAVPPSIQALLAERLDQLSDDERAVIERAAVVGREFWREAVVDLSAPSARDAVGSHLMALVRKELIRPDVSEPARGDGFRFQHILIRDVAYEALPMSVRADLHERFADWLESRGTDLVELDELVGYHLEQAYHYQVVLRSSQADARHLASRASQRLESAGRRALARSDLAAAINLLQRSADLLDDDARRAALLPDLGAAQMEAGNFAEAEAILAEAGQLARSAEDERAESRVLVQQQFLGLYRLAEEGTEEAAQLVERVIPVFERHDDHHGLCRARRLQGTLHWIEARAAAAAESWQQAAAYARQAGDENERSEILCWLGSSLLFGPVPVSEGIRRCERMRAELAGNLASEAEMHRSIAGLHAMEGRFDLARSLLASSDHIFEELGQTLNSAISHAVAIVELLAGDPAAAERSLRAGYEALEEMGERAYLSTTAAYLAQAIFAQERHEEAEQLTELSEQLSASCDLATQVMWRGVRARILEARGETGPAERFAREAVALAERSDFLNHRADALMDLAQVLQAGRRVDESAQATVQALALFEEKGNVAGAAKARGSLESLAQV